jgi:hypothetical protein
MHAGQPKRPKYHGLPPAVIGKLNHIHMSKIIIEEPM